MRPVDVTRIQGPRLLVGLSFLVQPVVELQHAVHPASPAGIIRHLTGSRTASLCIHNVQNPAWKRTSEMAIIDNGGCLPAGRTEQTPSETVKSCYLVTHKCVEELFDINKTLFVVFSL